MRQILLTPQIPVTFEEKQALIRVQGVPASILEVTNEGGVLLQARTNIGDPAHPIMAQRTYILRGAQFWQLTSGHPAFDAEAAGLFMAKHLMARGPAHATSEEEEMGHADLRTPANDQHVRPDASTSHSQPL